MGNFYRRTNIANKFSKLILSEQSSSGIFLSAPHRTGKSTFIREDLIPLIKQSQPQSCEIIYVDL